MLLYEHEAKRLAAEHGLPVPDGGLWPDRGATAYPLAVKAQVLEGGRGKRGGILFAADRTELEGMVARLATGTARLGPAAAILVERKLAIRRELYLAILMDRDAGAPTLLASPNGGFDIELVPEARVVRVPLSATHGPSPTDVDVLARALELDDRAGLRDAVAAAWSLFSSQDCALVEINPLALTEDGTLVAADLRVVLDDNARWRHPEWPPERGGTPFERACAALGATGIELSGDIAVISNGAGLGMATLDRLAAAGGRARCLVDLAGSALKGAGSFLELVDLVEALAPKVTVVNLFFQVASCEDYANVLAGRGRAAPVVARFAGRGAVRANEILEGTAVRTAETMGDACDRAARS